MKLDLDQVAVVNAPSRARQIVEAPPGCGKTQVACARVASLLDRGENPESILLISFTRTAVYELRKRISSLAKGGMTLARGVEIRTLDSLAWQLTAGTGTGTRSASYEDGIQLARTVLKLAAQGKNADLSEYIGRFAHVLVDEGQDLVGERAFLIVDLLNGFHLGVGWTIFLDPAQAIYGWSMDDGAAQLLDILGRLTGEILRVKLKKVYRTTDSTLLSTMAELRTTVLSHPPGERLANAHRILSETAEGDLSVSNIAALIAQLGQEAENSLVLFRNRADALFALSYLRGKGLNCKLRIGGMPRLSAPWIAFLSAQLLRAGVNIIGVSRENVEAAWSQHVAGRWISQGLESEDAWQLLCRMGKNGKRVDLQEVAQRLAASSVPDEVFTRDLGSGGAVLGTVHGSKGREAHRVVFCLPEMREEESNPDKTDEEARVLYVAASRATHVLSVHRSSSSRCGGGDRAWHSTKDGGVQVEIGIEGDLNPTWPMLRDGGKFGIQLQELLASFDGQFQVAHVDTDSDWNWTRYLKVQPSGELIGTLSLDCVSSLQRIVSGRAHKNVKAPLKIAYLTWVDVTTIAVRADDPCLENLPSPWREARMLLAPVVAGMGKIKRYW